MDRPQLWRFLRSRIARHGQYAEMVARLGVAPPAVRRRSAHFDGRGGPHSNKTRLGGGLPGNGYSQVGGQLGHQLP